jgi:hypothetical protein
MIGIIRYTDGAIVREGPIGDGIEGAFSTGVCVPLLFLLSLSLFILNIRKKKF